MKSNGFTLIELLAVIVILAIIAVIAVPIILDIINDSKEESNKRSIEMYAKALKNSIAKYQLDGRKLGVSKLETIDGRNFSNKNDFKVEYDGNVACEVIEIYADGTIYLEKCKVNGEAVKYTYGKKASFADDSWDRIVANIKAGYMYNVGETKEIKLEGFTNEEPNSNGLYTVRIANLSTPSECNDEDFSQTACGFVVEFVDVISQHCMNPSTTEHPSGTNIGGYPASSMYTYIKNDIFNTLPGDLKNIVIDTKVISSHGSEDTANFESIDKMYLLSTKEIWNENKNGYDTSTEQTRQLDYYKNLGVTNSNRSGAVKNYKKNATWWWLRSANTYNTSFYIIDPSGYNGTVVTHYNYGGVSPAFRVG